MSKSKKENDLDLEAIRALMNNTILLVTQQIIGCSILLDISCNGDAFEFKKDIADRLNKVIKDFLGDKLKCIRPKDNKGTTKL